MDFPKPNMGSLFPSRTALIALIAFAILLTGMPGTVAATDSGVDGCDKVTSDEDGVSDEEAQQRCELDHTFTDIGNFIVFIVVAIAVPNGAYGFLEWMTANDSVEKDDRGRRRIRNTFIALGGVGVLRFMVEMMKIFVPGI